MSALGLYRVNDRKKKWEAATLAMEEAIAHAWPIGTEVEFTLSSRQVNPSVGQVIAHHENRIAIRMERRNQRYALDCTVVRVGTDQMLTPARPPP